MAEMNPVNLPEGAGAPQKGADGSPMLREGGNGTRTTPPAAAALTAAGAPALPSGAESGPAVVGGGAVLLSHLQSLRELQAILSQEGRDEGILREGTAGTVEIVGADCAITLIEPTGSFPALRYGWNQGRHMAAHEIEILSRRLEQPIAQIREGRAPRLILGPESGIEELPPDAGSAPPDGPTGLPLRSRRFGSVLLLDIGSGAGRRGVLILGRHQAVPFTKEQALLAEILAAQMSIQIDRARRASDARRSSDRLAQEVEETTRALRERNQELVALNAVAAAAGPSLDPSRQIEVALGKAVEATRHTVGIVHLVREEGGEEILGFSGISGNADLWEPLRSRTYRIGEGPPGQVWRVGEPFVVPDLKLDQEVEGGEELAHAGCRALICVPLRARSRTIGTLTLAADTERHYGEAEVHLAREIANQLAVVIQNARLFSEVMGYSLELEARLQERGRELARRELESTAILPIVEASTRSSDTRILLEEALGRVLQALGPKSDGEAKATAGAAHLIDPQERTLRLRAQNGLPPKALEALTTAHLGRSIVGRAFETGGPIVADSFDPAAPPEEDWLDGSGLRLLAAVPLRAASGVHGVLSVAGRGEVALDREEIGFLAAVGRLLGMAVENARAFQETARSQPHDGDLRPKDLPAQLVAAQKMESVGTLAAGIAHEFNNILGAILGYASHIKGLATPDNPIHRQAATIEHQAQRAAELTQQLLAFARGGQYSLEALDLNALITETTSFLSKSSDPRVTIESHLDPDLPAVEADAGQMKQVLLNLAVNALEAMPDGGRLTFETRIAHLDERFVQSCPGLPPGDYAAVVVGDTGIGIPPETADRVFEPFFTTKGEGQGTGLGLSVVYGVIRNHGGHVSLSSTPGLGTTVRLYLPTARRRGARPGAEPSRPAVEPPRPAAARPAPVTMSPAAGPDEPGAPAAEAERPAAPAPSAGPQPEPQRSPAAVAAPAGHGRILIVDDEPALRDMMQDVLTTAGYEVILASDGVEALEVYRQEWGRIDLVLLDMVMPRMGGLETYRRILGMDRGGRVLLCSGYADSQQAQQALKLGALGFLPKPFSTVELLARVRKALRRVG
jgi:signal transduction histidine kinase/ActR/RegA family two-component response regulator